MRRLARWTINVVTVLSLVMCVATAGLWVRSYWRSAIVDWRGVFDPSGRGVARSKLERSLITARGWVRVKSEYHVWAGSYGATPPQAQFTLMERPPSTSAIETL